MERENKRKPKRSQVRPPAWAPFKKSERQRLTERDRKISREKKNTDKDLEKAREIKIERRGQVRTEKGEGHIYKERKNIAIRNEEAEKRKREIKPMKLFSIALNSPNKMRRKRDRESGHECARGRERVCVRVSQ